MGVEVNNLTQVWAATAGDAILGVVAGADQAFPQLDAGTGIDGNSCVQFANGGTALIPGDWYSGYRDGLTSFDMSSGQKVVFYFRNAGTPTFTSIAGLRIAFLNPGLTEYAYYEKNINSEVLDTSFQIIDASGTPTFSTGGYDPTDNVAIAILFEALDASFFGFQGICDQFQYIDPANPVEFATDGVPGTVGMDDFYQFLLPSTTSGPEHTLLFPQLGGLLYEYGFPYIVTHDDYNDGFPGLTMAPKLDDGLNFSPAAGYYSGEWNPGSGTQVLDSVAFPNLSVIQNLTLNGSSGVITVTGFSAGGLDTFTLQGTNLSVTGATINDPVNTSISDGLIDLTVNTPTNTVTMESVLQSGSELQINTPPAIALQINTEPLDHSGTAIRLPTTQMDLNGTTPGNYDLTGLENTDAGPISIDTLDTNIITADISGTVNAVSIDPNLTLVPPPENAGVNFPNLPAGRIRLYNQTTDTEIEETTIVAGYTRNWVNGTDFTDGDIGILYFVSELEYDLAVEFVAPPDTVLELVNTPETDDVYAAYGIDGSTVTGYTFDEGNIQIDIGVVSEFLPDEMYAWYKYTREADPGLIEEFFGAIVPVDTSNLVADSNVVDLFLDNTGATTITQGVSGSISGYILFRRSDGVYPQVNPTSGGGGIGLYYEGIGYGAAVGEGPLTPIQAAQLSNASSTGTQNVALNTTIDGNVDQLLLDVAAVPTGEENADAWSNRNIDGGSNAGRLNKDAIKANRNRVSIDVGANTLTVYEEDDTTEAWSADITTGIREPINSVDP
ncbi:hypothetical protein KAR91_05180 [Candidatus Pacearchaeota archaeon]|nr:hypothetical protein [Candidatus Pacearchaeota archaeon]